MRSLLLCSLPLAIVLLPSLAFAQNPRDKSNSQFKLRQGDIAGGAGETARAHARAGDCQGALEYFDRAITVYPEPGLQRDRGLCHDKLNQPYPAIEDYRAYLAARPEAPDSENIRQRLGALEGANGIPAENNKGDSAEAQQSPAQRDAIETLIKDERNQDAAATSPLRDASGMVLGVYGGTRTFFGDNTSSFFQTGKGDSLGFEAGIALRYSFGKYFTLLFQGGYVGFGTTGENTGASGPGFLLAGELRIPVTKNSSDHFLVAFGPGYERYVANESKATLSDIMGIGRLGFRHVFGANFGLEFDVYGGLAHVSYLNPPLGVNVSDVNQGILGLQLDVLVGF
jgi:hypothetical protein